MVPISKEEWYFLVFFEVDGKDVYGLEVSLFLWCRVTLWRLIPYAVLRSVWLERNARIFKQASMSREEVAELVLAHITKRASSREDFGSIRVGGIPRN